MVAIGTSLSWASLATGPRSETSIVPSPASANPDPG